MHLRGLNGLRGACASVSSRRSWPSHSKVAKVAATVDVANRPSVTFVSPVLLRHGGGDRDADETMGVTRRDIDTAVAQHKGRFGTKREGYFALLYITREFERTVDQVARHISFTDAGSDGFNAFHVDLTRRTLYIFQFVWDSTPSALKGPLKTLAEVGLDRVFGNIPDSPSPLVSELRNCIYQDQAVIDRVLVHFVFNGDPEEAEQGALLDALREDLESKAYLVRNAFSGREVPITLHYKSNEDFPPPPPPPPPPLHGYELEVTSFIGATGTGGESLSVGFVRLIDLHRMHKQMGPRLFERNIRAGLDPDVPVNKKLRAAFADVADGAADPSVFVFHHNGVTLAAEELVVSDGKARVFEPRVLNGAQTISSLAKFIDDAGSREPKFDAEARLGSIRVLAKIVTRASKPFVTSVTLNTNRQNPVDPANLRASDEIQLELQDKFRRELNGLIYERQERLLTALSEEEKIDQGFDPSLNRAIEIKRLAKTFLAVQGEVDRMSKINDVFESETQYRACFAEKYLKSDSRRIVLVYKIQFRLPKVLRSIQDAGQFYDFMPRAKNLLWALLAQGTLNHQKVDDWTESYGAALRNESEFTDELVTLAVNKVRHLIRLAIQDAKYKGQFDEGKLGFLRTKAFCNHCVELAADKYGWSRQGL